MDFGEAIYVVNEQLAQGSTLHPSEVGDGRNTVSRPPRRTPRKPPQPQRLPTPPLQFQNMPQWDVRQHLAMALKRGDKKLVIKTEPTDTVTAEVLPIESQQSTHSATHRAATPHPVLSKAVAKRKKHRKRGGTTKTRSTRKSTNVQSEVMSDDEDSAFFEPVTTPTAARTGDTDKMWIYCTHKRDGEHGDCGVHYVRNIRRSPLGLQHHCLADTNHKLLTRTMGTLFKDCTFCTDSCAPSGQHCIRAATMEEIAEYQRKCKTLGIVPNGKRGGFKKIGARTTRPGSYRSKTTTKSKRKSGRKRKSSDNSHYFEDDTSSEWTGDNQRRKRQRTENGDTNTNVTPRYVDCAVYSDWF